MYSDGSSCCSNSQRGVFVPAAWNLESKLTKVSQILLRNRASSNVCPNVLFWLAELARIFNEIPARERENLKLIFSSWIKNHQPIRSAIIDLLCKNIYLPSCVIAPPPSLSSRNRSRKWKCVKDCNIRTPVGQTWELLKHASREVKSPIDVGCMEIVITNSAEQ